LTPNWKSLLLFCRERPWIWRVVMRTIWPGGRQLSTSGWKMAGRLNRHVMRSLKIWRQSEVFWKSLRFRFVDFFQFIIFRFHLILFRVIDDNRNLSSNI
jgi:hypothetical protein